MIIINFKNYKLGKEAIDLTRKIEIYYNKAIIAVPTLELAEVIKNTTMPVYAQHVDSAETGRGTGKILPESLINVGAAGSLLNHSEHRVPLKNLKETIKRCNEVGLKLIVCASSIRETKTLAKLNPYAIAFEDPKLIATGKSITNQKSHEIKEFVKSLENTEIMPLCGAGITSAEDVAAALVMGCKGVLVSSAVANSQNPEKFLKELGSLI